MSDKIAELEAKLSGFSPDEARSETRIDVLNGLARELSLEHPDRSIELACEALELSEQLSYKKGEATARMAPASRGSRRPIPSRRTTVDTLSHRRRMRRPRKNPSSPCP